MHCRAVRKRLVAWQDDELAPRERARIQSHLHRCRSCRELEVRLGRVTPAPFLRLDPAQEERLRERLDAALAPELERMPAARPETRWERARAWLSREARIPTVALIGYLVLLGLALGWGVQSWWTAQRLQVAMQQEATWSAAPVEIPATQYRPAFYVPDEDDR